MSHEELTAHLVRETGLTFDQVRQLNLYDRMLLLGYKEAASPIKAKPSGINPAGKRRPRRAMKLS